MNGEITFRAVLGSGFLAVLGITLYHRLTSWASRERLDRRQEIGIVATAPASELLSRVITRCAARHPNVHVLVEELPTPLQRPKLARGEIDLGLAHAFPTLGRTKGDGIVALTVHEDRLDSALVAANHPLAGRRHIEARELADFPFLFMERSFHPGFYDRTHATLEGLGLVPRVEATYDGLQAVWSLAAQGRGWALAFQSQRARPPGGTATVRIRGFNLPWGLDLLSRRGESSPAVRAVVAVFRAVRRVGKRKH